MNDKKTIILLIISILIVISATVGITFAYLSVSAVQETPNTISTTCYDLSFTDSNIIKLTSYPMSDKKGLTLTPYTFNIKNTCSGTSNYQVLLNIKNTTTLDYLSYIHYSIDGINSNILSNATKVDLPGGSRADIIASYVLDIGSITDLTKTYNLRLWLGEHGGNDIMNKKFEAEVMVYAVASTGTTENLKKALLTNLIPDSSFEDGDWTTGQRDATHTRYGNYALKLTGTANAPEIATNTRTTIALNSSHIYYARYELYHEGASGSAGLYWPTAEPYFFEGSSLGASKSWNIVSKVNNRSSFSNTNAVLRLDYNNNNATTSVWYDGAMLIDLTEAFGSGNEPDVAWCDANIPYFTGSETINYSNT